MVPFWVPRGALAQLGGSGEWGVQRAGGEQRPSRGDYGPAPGTLPGFVPPFVPVGTLAFYDHLDVIIRSHPQSPCPAGLGRVTLGVPGWACLAVPAVRRIGTWRRRSGGGGSAVGGRGRASEAGPLGTSPAMGPYLFLSFQQALDLTALQKPDILIRRSQHIKTCLKTQPSKTTQTSLCWKPLSRLGGPRHGSIPASMLQNWAPALVSPYFRLSSVAPAWWWDGWPRPGLLRTLTVQAHSRGSVDTCGWALLTGSCSGLTGVRVKAQAGKSGVKPQTVRAACSLEGKSTN